MQAKDQYKLRLELNREKMVMKMKEKHNRIELNRQQKIDNLSFSDSEDKPEKKDEKPAKVFKNVNKNNLHIKQSTLLICCKKNNAKRLLTSGKRGQTHLIN